ncbi:hypothetical protein M9H77_09623 [Catharanthus roseus]|uniref:Uncharacterized protein n=1 Tax=Catharanthus roseus TaxID=4058 RepID=A0ACC0C1N8_CATRO|nr:hypothetical protein M9H77_09623 [Catharanthus roseus]
MSNTEVLVSYCENYQEMSNLRNATEEQRKRALHEAEYALKEAKYLGECFKVVMQRSCVSGSFNMKVLLHHEGREWKTNLYSRRDGRAGVLTAGWKKFMEENSLKESDVCLFTLSTKTANSIGLKVLIFRITEEGTSAAKEVDSLTKYIRTHPKQQRKMRYPSEAFDKEGNLIIE